MAKKSYKANDVQVLEGLEPVKLRPGMYTNTETPNHIIDEVIDNACDEALAGFANEIDIIIEDKNTVIVKDNGRGIPIEKHPVKKISTVEVVFTLLHAGGKFSKEDEESSYRFTGGLHGVGVSVTNALSNKLEVKIKKDGGIYSIAFSNGDKVKEIEKIGEYEGEDSGTEVLIEPNMEYFYDPIDFKKLEERIRTKAVLLNGIKFNFINKLDNIKKSFLYQDGLDSYVREKAQSSTIIGEVYTDERFITKEEENNGIGFSLGEGVSWSICWTEEGPSFKESFVNLIPTKLGGTHENGFKTGIFEAVKSFITHNALLPKGVNLIADDVFSKSIFVLSAKILDPQFHGQTKEKLNNRTSARLMNLCVKDKIEQWFNENPTTAKTVVEQAIRNAQLRAKKGKKDNSRRANNITLLPGKLTDCQSDNYEENEIFIVEGDSAGGSAKEGREKLNQAILPLRGKSLNTWEIDKETIIENNEIKDISIALGIDPHSLEEDIDLSKLRYHKVAILSDADKDGQHIQVLLLSMFLQHFPKLITGGYIYISKPPLYRIDVDKKGRRKAEKHYITDEAELFALIKKLKKSGLTEKDYTKMRFKGLGEMSPMQLWETTLNPDTRNLMQVTIAEDSIEEAKEKIDMLLAKKRANERRRWIEDKGDFISKDE